MTTSPVVSVTDELIAELNAVAHTGGGAFMIECAEVHALLAERAELKLDAERYRFWRYMATHEPSKMARILAFYENQGQLDAAIDAAMQS